MKKIFSIIYALSCAMIVAASGTQVNGIYYNFRSDGTAEVTYRGNSFDSYSNEYIGSVAIPSSVTYNGRQYSVTSIGSAAFSGCTGLTSITIPNSVTSIGNAAFWDCSGLTSITIPNSVTSIGYAAFAGCSGLNSITVETSNRVYDSRNNCNAIIETASNTVLSGCKNTIIPNSVTSVGESAFDGCSSLTSITIPNSVTSIGNYAFWDCSGLTSITIPNSVTSIGYAAFENCTSLISVFIGTGVASIGGAAFENCPSLTSIVIDNNNPKYDSRENCNALIETTTNTLLMGCKSTTIPNSVTSVGESAFEGCSGLLSITIPSSVTSIGYGAFKRCTSLTSITIPNSTTNIEEDAFEHCKSLTSVSIGNSVTSIGSYAFADCPYLRAVHLNANLRDIGEAAFEGCTRIESITCLAERTPNVGPEALDDISSYAYLYVLAGCKHTYQIDSKWNRFDIRELGASEGSSNGNVVVVPGNNDATFTWPIDGSANNYTLQITKDGEVFCTLIFNGNGQLQGIAFAPSRDGRAQLPAATIAANGMTFTVTGLDFATHYGYSIQVKDNASNVLKSYSGYFHTNGTTNLEDISTAKNQKIFRDGQIHIQTPNGLYTIDGRKVE